MEGYLDQDTTDAFLDGDVPKYEDGKTSEQRDAEKGYAGISLGDLADAVEAREGRKLPELPPLTEH